MIRRSHDGAVLPIVGIVILVGVSALGVTLVDAGYTSTWPRWARFPFAAGIVLTLVGAVALLHKVLSPEHSELSLDFEPDYRGPGLRRGLLVGTAGALGFAGLALLLDTHANVPFDRTSIVGIGGGIIWATVRKPWWFWDHWRAQILRRVIGDTPTVVLYLVLAALFIYVGLFGDPSQLRR